MVTARLTPLLCSAILALGVNATPSPGALGSDIQVLLHNDLYGNASARQDSVLVLSKAQTQAAAASACSALGESLWSPPNNLNTDNFLPYLAYQAGASATAPGPSGPSWPSWPSWGHWKSKRGYPPGPPHGPPGWGHGPPAWGPPHGPPGKPPVGPPAAQQLYYIAGNQGGQCQAITTSAQIVAVNCNAALPALCSNSAPLSGIAPWTMNATPIAVADTSARFQTSVKSGGATFTGFRDKVGYRFLGIDFADFDQRFDYSSVVNATGAVSALAIKPHCWQIDGIEYRTNGVEHCLNLNVFTNYLPNGNSNSTALKPVFMWIHGGGLTSGYGSDPTWDGGNLASRGDIVVVDINYRLGTFGWFQLPNNTAVHGNQGFGDQVNALKWIKANIEAFGGDPNNVVIGGQSSGGASVQAHLRSPASAGLFHGAIQHSIGYSVYSTIPQAVTRQTNPILNLTGCAGSDQAAELACLRAYDAASLVNLATVGNSMVVDGEYFTTPTLTFNSSSWVNKVPFMLGNMRDDGTPFIHFIQTTNLTTSLSQNGQAVQTVLNNPSVFPLPSSGNATYDVFNASTIVATDTFARCGTQAVAFAGAATHTFPEVYYFENNRSYQIPYWPLFPLTALCNAPKDATHPGGNPDKEYFKCHSGDLTTTFSTWRRWGLPERDANDTPYEQMILDYWTSFVRTHTPNPDLAYLAARGYVNTTAEVTAQGPWATVSASNPTGRVLEWPSVQLPFSHTQQCALLGSPTNGFVPAS